MLVPVIATLAVVVPLALLTLPGRPTPRRGARDRLIARNPMLADAQLAWHRWRADYVGHRRSDRPTGVVRALVTRLAVATALSYGTYCDRRPPTAVPAWYDR